MAKFFIEEQLVVNLMDTVNALKRDLIDGTVEINQKDALKYFQDINSAYVKLIEDMMIGRTVFLGHKTEDDLKKKLGVSN